MKITTAEPPAPPATRSSRADDDAVAGAGAQFLAVLAGVTAQPSHATAPKGGQHDAPAKDGAAPARATTATRSSHATTGTGEAQARAQHDDAAPTPSPASAAAGDATEATTNATATATTAKPGAGAPTATPAVATPAVATGAVPTTAPAAAPTATTPPTPATPAAPTPTTTVEPSVTAPNATSTSAAQHAIADATDDVTAAVVTATDVTGATDATDDARDGTSRAVATGTPPLTNTATVPNPAPTTAVPGAPVAARPPSSTSGDAGRGATPDQQRSNGAPVSAPAVSAPLVNPPSPARDATSSPQSQSASHDATATNPTVAQAPAVATPQPAATPAQVAAPPAPAAPPNPVVTTPVAQLVSVVEPLRDQPDGSYRMTVDLHPADLGRVQVEVKLERGEVSLHLQADHASTSTLLRDALHDLRERLQSAGLRTGGVVVGHNEVATGGGNGPFDGGAGGTGSRAATSTGTNVDEVADVPNATTGSAPTSSDALVDVRV